MTNDHTLRSSDMSGGDVEQQVSTAGSSGQSTERDGSVREIDSDGDSVMHDASDTESADDTLEPDGSRSDSKAQATVTPTLEASEFCPPDPDATIDDPRTIVKAADAFSNATVSCDRRVDPVATIDAPMTVVPASSIQGVATSNSLAHDENASITASLDANRRRQKAFRGGQLASMALLNVINRSQPPSYVTQQAAPPGFGDFAPLYQHSAGTLNGQGSDSASQVSESEGIRRLAALSGRASGGSRADFENLRPRR